jgi:hypothetical protein
MRLSRKGAPPPPLRSACGSARTTQATTRPADNAQSLRPARQRVRQRLQRPLQLAVRLPLAGDETGLARLTSTLQRTAGIASVAAPRLNTARDIDAHGRTSELYQLHTLEDVEQPLRAALPLALTHMSYAPGGTLASSSRTRLRARSTSAGTTSRSRRSPASTSASPIA